MTASTRSVPRDDVLAMLVDGLLDFVEGVVVPILLDAILLVESLVDEKLAGLGKEPIEKAQNAG